MARHCPKCGRRTNASYCCGKQVREMGEISRMVFCRSCGKQYVVRKNSGSRCPSCYTSN